MQMVRFAVAAISDANPFGEKAAVSKDLLDAVAWVAARSVAQAGQRSSTGWCSGMLRVCACR